MREYDNTHETPRHPRHGGRSHFDRSPQRGPGHGFGGPRGFFGGPGGVFGPGFGPLGEENGFDRLFGTPQRGPRGGLGLGLLAIIAEKPQHGYALIQAFSQKTNGNWEPKSGAIYPALNKLVAEELAAVDEQGVYTLTDKGQQTLEQNRPMIDAMFARFDGKGGLSPLLPATAKLLGALRQTASLSAEDQQEIAEKLEALRKEIHLKLAQ